MNKTLENVHVVIYSKKMLKQAFDRLKNLKQNVQGKVFVDFECHDNDMLIFHNGTFKMVHFLPTNPCYEVTLNDLCEMVIDKEGEKQKELKFGRWYVYGYAILNYQGTKGRNLIQAYGALIDGSWLETSSCGSSPECWNLAAMEVVEKVLIEEAVKRGFKGGFIFDDRTNILWNQYNSVERAILSGGKWAQIVEVDKFADLKKAHAEGAVIQIKDIDTDIWDDLAIPAWHENREYRIKPEPKVKMGDYVITELKNQPSPGFSAYQLSIQNSVDVLNSEDCQYNFKIISKEKFEELRKAALC